MRWTFLNYAIKMKLVFFFFSLLQWPIFPLVAPFAKGINTGEKGESKG